MPPRSSRSASLPPPMLSIEVDEPFGHVPRVRLYGEIDSASAPTASRRLREVVRPGRPLVVDVSGLTSCDSQGVQMLFDIARVLAHAGGSLSIVNPQGIVRRVFDVVRIADRVNVEYDECPAPTATFRNASDRR